MSPPLEDFPRNKRKMPRPDITPVGLAFDLLTAACQLSECGILLALMVYDWQAGWTALFGLTCAFFCVTSLFLGLVQSLEVVDDWPGFNRPDGDNIAGKVCYGFVYAPIGWLLPTIDLMLNLFKGIGEGQRYRPTLRAGQLSPAEEKELAWAAWQDPSSSGRTRREDNNKQEEPPVSAGGGKHEVSDPNATTDGATKRGDVMSQVSRDQLRGIRHSVRLSRALFEAISRRAKILKPFLASALSSSVPQFLVQLLALNLGYYRGGHAPGAQSAGPPYGLLLALLVVASWNAASRVFLICHSFTVGMVSLKCLAVAWDLVSTTYMVSFLLNPNQPQEVQLFGFHMSHLSAIYVVSLLVATTIGICILVGLWVKSLVEYFECVLLLLVPFFAIILGPPLILLVLMSKLGLLLVNLWCLEPDGELRFARAIGLYHFIESSYGNRNEKFEFVLNLILTRIQQAPKKDTYLSNSLRVVTDVMGWTLEEKNDLGTYGSDFTLHQPVKSSTNNLSSLGWVDPNRQSFHPSRLMWHKDDFPHCICYTPICCGKEKSQKHNLPQSVSIALTVLAVFQTYHGLLPFVAFPLYYDSHSTFTLVLFGILCVLTFVPSPFLVPHLLRYLRYLNQAESMTNVNEWMNNGLVRRTKTDGGIGVGMKDLEAYFLPPQTATLRAHMDTQSGLIPMDLIDHCSTFMPPNSLDLTGLSLQECWGMRGLESPEALPTREEAGQGGGGGGPQEVDPRDENEPLLRGDQCPGYGGKS